MGENPKVMQQIEALISTFNNAEFRKDLKKLEYDINKEDLEDIFNAIYQQLIDKTINFSYKEIYQIKSKQITRRVIQFSLDNAILYFFLVLSLQDKIAFNRVPNTFGGFRMDSIKLRKIEREEQDIYFDGNVQYGSINKSKWNEAYSEFNGICKKFIEKNECNYVYITDIANFYDNINLSILEEKINNVLDKELKEICDALFYFLKYWDVKINGFKSKTMGIPQDKFQEGSRLLSNFYLQDFDSYIYEKCKIYNVSYLRYADDIRFFGADEKSLESIMYLSSKYLSLLNLNFNSKKTILYKIDDFNKKFYSINFLEKDIKLFAQSINDNKDLCNDEISNRAKKRLLNSINKEDFNENYISIIDEIISVPLIIDSFNQYYEFEILSKVVKKYNIEKKILILLREVISETYCINKLQNIKKYFPDLKNDCENKITILGNL